MIKGALAGLMIVAATVAGGGRAEAQSLLPLSVEARIDAGIPLGDSGDLYENGVGFGITGLLQLTPVFGLYGGYSQFTFDQDAIPGGGERESNGGEVGGRVTLGTGGGLYNPFAQIGAIFHDDDTGIEAGLGAFYPVGQNLSLTPMVRYRSVSDLDYLTLGVGLNLRF
ncbi:MAG TPA: hypothetical protein VE913_15690 [Longimicrobium sp.]|nr:hypothetical protein [Longimicrobium sp.]